LSTNAAISDGAATPIDWLSNPSASAATVQNASASEFVRLAAGDNDVFKNGMPEDIRKPREARHGRCVIA
jgi:hypothetical protein